MVPESGLSSDANKRSRVVLPLPFSPTSPMIPPAYSSRLTSLSENQKLELLSSDKLVKYHESDESATMVYHVNGFFVEVYFDKSNAEYSISDPEH